MYIYTSFKLSTELSDVAVLSNGVCMEKRRTRTKLGITCKRMEGRVLFQDKGPSTKEMLNWSD